MTPEKNIRNEDDLVFDSSNVRDSLKKLHDHAIRTTTRALNWYWSAKDSQKLLSRCLRLVAIVATAVGGLLPMIGAAMGQAEWGWGYMFLAVAGACVTLDKFFGFSSTWMRCVTTATALESDLSRFRLDWYRLMADAGAAPQMSPFLERVLALNNTVRTRIEEETAMWVAEYRTSLAELDRRVEAQRKEQEPGGVEVDVADAGTTDDGVVVNLESRPPQTTRGGTLTFPHVPPGQYRIEATGKIGGTEHRVSRLVVVTAGKVVPVSLKLKP